MAKATCADSTGALVAHPLAGAAPPVPAIPSPHRRGLLASAAAALAAAPFAASYAAQLRAVGAQLRAVGASVGDASPDAELLALAAELAEKDAHVTSAAYDLDDAFYSAEHDRWWQIVHRVTDLPAQTENGRAAKATILAAVIRDCCREDDSDALLALSLIRDLTGRAGA